MSETLLPYYRTELAFIRDLAAQFAEAYPNVATSLKLNRDAAGDPHVERLIEAVAYLNARLRHKLDDEFPELTDALLGVLYPHYLSPIPSMSIVQLHLDKGQADRAAGHLVPAGRELESEMVDGQSCRFNTCYPVQLYPIEIAAAALSGPRVPSGRGAAPGPGASAPATPGVLRLELRCLSRSVSFGQLQMDRLRLFLHGQGQHVLALYELLLNHTTAITIADPDGRAAPVVIGPEHIVPVGFEPEEGMLPYPSRSLPGYRLLSEYFALPEKFMFVELAGLRERLTGIGRRAELCFHLDRTATALEKVVNADTFRLGCTPVVNLFRQRAEPIRLSHEQTEYHVVPDARRTNATEVYSIERVTATSPDGSTVEYLPFYSVRHGGRRAEGQAYWHASRGGLQRPSGEVGRGREVFLSLVDLEHSPAVTADAVIDVETICLNRDLPARLPFGGGRPRLQMVEGGVVARVECLRPPTATRRPASREGAIWRIVSHLSLNHLSITGEEGAAALREILHLYDGVDSQDTRSRTAGLLGVRTQRVTARVGRGAAAGFCRGIEVTLELDEEGFPDNGLYLFASVLERFLGLYCSINSFVAVVVATKQRGEIRRWPPRAGEQVLV